MTEKKPLSIAKTAETPSINFDYESGIMQITGRSIPSSSDDFWNPILDWFDSYLNSPNDSTKFIIQLDYFNISSSKKVLQLLYKLNELNENGKEARVEWNFRKGDDDMYEVGQDYAYMVKVPFNFVCLEEELVMA